MALDDDEVQRGSAGAAPAARPSAAARHAAFIAAVCDCLDPSALRHWLPDGIIVYRDIRFAILPHEHDGVPMLDITVELGEIHPAKRLAAYRHMAAYNLVKGAPDHGVLGLNSPAAGAAVHQLFLPRTDPAKPGEVARSLEALAVHARDFRACFGASAAGNNVGSLGRLASRRDLFSAGPDREVQRAV